MGVSDCLCGEEKRNVMSLLRVSSAFRNTHTSDGERAQPLSLVGTEYSSAFPIPDCAS